MGCARISFGPASRGSGEIMSEKAIINLEETIGKTVGRRRPPSDALAAADVLQRTVNELLEATGHRLTPRGVFRFRSHEEADAWMIRMLRPRK